MNPEQAMGLAILTPLVGAIGVLLTGRFPNLRETVTMIASLTTLGLVFSILPDVQGGKTLSLDLVQVFPGFTSGNTAWEGVWLAFEVEPLGMLYALVASILWVPTSMYAVGYMRGHNEDNQTRFFACFAMAIFAALGIAFAKNLFTLFLFYEVLTLSTYPLVTHYGNDEAKRAGRIYMGILLTTSVAFLLLGVMGTYYFAGTADFKLGGILSGRVQPWQAMILLALYAFGTGKAALMPFHKWLPNAMVAPTPVSALLHAVAIVKAGVFTILKVVVYVFGINFLQEAEVVITIFKDSFTFETGVNTWLMYLAAFTLLSSSIIALSKDNLKARLAYSTISQLAYIVLGAAIATEAAVMGAGLHIAMHAIGKITLFFCAGAIYVALHKKYISQMHGIGRKMPFTMGAFFLGSLCIIGVPPMGGSWSKWYLAIGAIDADQMIFVVVLMVSSLLSIAYLMPVVVKAFFYEPQPDDHHDEHHHDEHHAPATEGTGFFGQLQEAPLFCVAPLCLTAAGCIAMFFGAPFVYDLIESITKVG